jgi:L-asparaginase
MLPKIKVFSLGGTIAMGAMKEGRGVSLSHSAEMLIDAVPALAEIAQIEGISFRQMPSPDLTMNDLIALSKAISESIDGGAAGIVVTQGTDTLEESAFVIDRLVEADAPVVFTGAMRNPTMPSPDGAANLYHAVITALAKETLGIGTLVVLNDEIHAARYVQKLHTTSPAAFQSSPVGPIGWVLENQAHLLAKPFKRYLIAGVSESAKIRVARLTVSIDDDGEMVDYVTRAGFDGLVIEATGGGHVKLCGQPMIFRELKRV